jgi:hypothetical protein
MAYTFDRAWRRIALQAPLVPVPLLQDWCRDAFVDACEWRLWSFMRGEGVLQTQAAVVGTCAVVNGSATVTLSGTLVGSAGAVGRQLWVASQYPIGILAYTAGAPDTLTLETPYPGPTGTVDATILDAWITVPADFGQWICVWDPTQQIDLWIDVTEQDLNKLDPGRTSYGDPYLLASRSTWGTGATVPIALRGLRRYELWPYLTSARGFPMLYRKVAPTLRPSTELPDPLGHSLGWLEEAVMSQVCKWPGTEQRRNPHFSLPAARDRTAESRRLLAETELYDEDNYPSWYLTRSPRHAQPVDAAYRQTHDWSPY